MNEPTTQRPEPHEPQKLGEVLEASGFTVRDCPHCGFTMFAHEADLHEYGHRHGIACASWKVAP